MTTLIFAIAMFSETFTGTITDTMCGAKHTMMKDQPDEKCVKMCVKGSSEYALFDGQQVIKLSDQSKPAKFAAKPVNVTGTLDPKKNTIKVTAIER
jgi:hypothetical protein